MVLVGKSESVNGVHCSVRASAFRSVRVILRWHLRSLSEPCWSMVSFTESEVDSGTGRSVRGSRTSDWRLRRTGVAAAHPVAQGRLRSYFSGVAPRRPHWTGIAPQSAGVFMLPGRGEARQGLPGNPLLCNLGCKSTRSVRVVLLSVVLALIGPAGIKSLWC